MTQKYHQMLENHFLFAHLNCESLSDLIDRAGKVYTYQDKQVILSPQNEEAMLGVVLKGSLEVYNSRLMLKSIEQGETFGAASIFLAEEPYVSTIVSKGQSTVYVLTKTALSELFATHAQSAINYIEFLSGRIVFLNQKLDLYTAQSVEEKVYAYLKTNSQDSKCQLHATRCAKELGIGRASLYRALDQLANQGKLVKQEKEIILL